MSPTTGKRCARARRQGGWTYPDGKVTYRVGSRTFRRKSAPAALAAAVLPLAILIGSACGSAGSAGSGAPAQDPAGKPPTGENGTEAPLVRGRVIAPSGRAFEVEIVQDAGSRERGLQHRAHLPENEGMLFIFPVPGKLRFWMYECLIPLDILWLDASGTVIRIEPNLPICPTLPCPNYGPDEDALYVLELGSGVAARSGIVQGQRLELLFAEPPHPQ